MVGMAISCFMATILPDLRAVVQCGILKSKRGVAVSYARLPPCLP